jgi:hypothetical protein|uniref:OTU domain-containing protein n=1 Tax=viral metagenome TaxID=1070528 RepID=A0A6C0BG97_9ZZZZ
MAAASANERFELPCDGDRSTCLDTLLDIMPELQYIEVPDDGDCFFHSIAAYYKRTGGIIIDRDTDLPLDIDPTNPRALRSYIVEEFIKLVVAKEPPYPELISTILIENRTRKSLSQLDKSGVWAVNTFDTMINAVPTILMINLNIYVVNQSQYQGYVITKAVYRPKQPELLNGRGLPTINLFLSGNHYGLLYPVGGDNVRSLEQIQENNSILSAYKAKKAKEYEAQVKEAQKYEAKLEREIAAKEARASRNAKPSVARNLSRKASYNNIAEIERQFAALEMEAKPSVARNLSRKASYNNIAEIERQFAALEMKAKSSAARNAARNVSRKASRNSSALNNASRQLIYQLYNENEKALHQSSKNNKIASLREQIRQLESASVRRKPSVAQRPIAPSLYNQRNISLRNRQNNAVDCDKLLAPQLREYLKARGYIGPPPLSKINKPELLSMCRKLQK